MPGVQCEACHGPAREHGECKLKIKAGAGKWLSQEDYQALLKRAGEVRLAGRVVEATCRQCHTPEYDDRFVFRVSESPK